MNKAVLWKQLLAIPGVVYCFKSVPKGPYGLGIGACILYNVGQVAYDLFNEYLQVSKCEENCRKLLDECQRLALSTWGPI
jgi:hypothetical protein